jgi:hypothetical protein
MVKTYPDQSLPAVRIAIGVGSWAVPEMTGKLFGFRDLGNTETVYMARLFGARDVALGVGTIMSGGRGRKLWLKLGIACDLADAAAAGLGLAEGGPKRAMIMAGATALLAVGMGVASLQAAD